MIRFALFLLMSLAVSSKVAAGVKNEKESLNIFVPDDVFEIFQNASPTVKAKKFRDFLKTLRNGYLVTTVEWITAKKLRALFKQTILF